MSETQNVDFSDGRMILYNAGMLGMLYLIGAIGFIAYAVIQLMNEGVSPTAFGTAAGLQVIFAALGMGMLGVLYGGVIGRGAEQLFQSELARQVKWLILVAIVGIFTALVVAAFPTLPIFLIVIPTLTIASTAIATALAMRPRQVKAPAPKPQKSPDEPEKAKLPTVDFKK